MYNVGSMVAKTETREAMVNIMKSQFFFLFSKTKWVPCKFTFLSLSVYLYDLISPSLLLHPLWYFSCEQELLYLVRFKIQL